MGIWTLAAGTGTRQQTKEKLCWSSCIPKKGPTFCTKHLSTVKAEEVLWVPGLVHCCQHFLEKEHTEPY